MAGLTNKGTTRILEAMGRAVAFPASFNVALLTSAVTPTADTNTMADVTQIATGNGYTDGGINVARNSTDFDTLTEDDTLDRALTRIKDLIWTASGGSIPASGGGARWAVLTDNNATVADREVWAFFDLTSDRTITDGQSLTLQDLEIRLTNT